MRPEILVATVVSSPSMRPLSLIRLAGPEGLRIRKYQTAVPAIERTTSATMGLRNLVFLISFVFSVQPLCSLCLCGFCSFRVEQPQRHREHRGCTEKSKLLLTCSFVLLQLQSFGNHRHVSITERVTRGALELSDRLV